MIEIDRDQKLYFYSLVLKDVIDSIERGETFIEDYEPLLSDLIRALDEFKDKE